MEQTCWLCKLPENAELRRRWGCEEPTKKPWDEIGCWVCRDQPANARELCPVCGGTQRLPLHDCPWKMIGEPERFACTAVSYLEVGVLPFGGLGWAELPATMADAITLVSAEKGLIDAARCKGD